MVISMVTQLILAVLLHLGMQAPAQLRFLALPMRLSGVSQSAATVDALQQIKPLLMQKANNFSLQKKTSLIESADAAGNFDQATSYLAINFNSGEVLAEKNMAAQAPIASLTKIMTAVVALDLASPNEMFTVTANDGRVEPTTIGVVPGQKMSLKELLDASLMTSANDAAQVIADGIDAKFNQPGLFVQAMNVKAESLGLKNTHFTNPQGFDDPNHYSSAEDLAILTHYALSNYLVISQTVSQDYTFLPADNNHKQFDLYNWNGLLDVYPGAYGVKIGNTDAAGYTTVVAAKRDGQNILAVLLGAPGVKERDEWAGELLDDAFSKLGVQPAAVTADQLQAKYNTWKYWN